jgi:hypothetical protein
MIVIHRILNAFVETFGLKETMDAVRAWIGQKDAEIFLAANPGLRFGNAGTCPTPTICADGSCACLDDAPSGFAASPSGGGAALSAAPSGGGAALGAAPSGAALCYTPNAKGRYSWYSGIPDLEVNPYDTPTADDTAAVTQALIDLSTASASDVAVEATTAAFAGLASPSSAE